MDNYTLQELRTNVDDDRGETNSAFVDNDRIDRYFNRAIRVILRKPGVRTIKDTQTITFTGSGTYALDADVMDVIELISGGVGQTNSVKFNYYPPDEFSSIIVGYAWTINSKGNIEIFATDINQLPTSSLTLLHWSRNIILDTDGSTTKAIWENDGDKSRLEPEFDDMYINYADSIIKRREGKKEWKDSFQLFQDALDSLIVSTGEPRPTRPLRQFGNGGSVSGWGQN